MRVELGFIGLTLGFWLAGAAVLLASGILERSWRSVLTWGGAAYVVGLSVAGIVATAAAYAGVGVSTTLTVVTILVVCAGGVATWRLVGPPVERRPAPRFPRDRGFLMAGAAVAAVFVFAGTALALVNPIYEWDGWAIWGVKAALLYEYGRVPDLLVTGDYALTSVDYPILWPALEATHQRAMGGVEPKLASLPHWVLYVAFAWTLAAVGSRLMRPALWVSVAVGTLTTYAIVDQLFWHYADVPTAILLAAGALFAGLWLEGHGARWLAPAAIVLGAAANGKNEGLVAVVALLAGLLVAALARRAGWRPAIPVVLVGVFVGLSILPWRLWLVANDVEGQVAFSDLIDPGLLADRADRVEPSASRLLGEIVDPSAWGLLGVAALALVVVAVTRRSTRAAALFYAVAAALVFLFLVAAYVVTTGDYVWRLDTSAYRVVHLLGFLGIAAILHLCAVLQREDEAPA